MRVFAFQIGGETEYVSGNTIIQAIKHYCDNSAMELIDLIDLDDSDDIREVPEEKWSDIQVRNSEYDETDPHDKEVFTLEELVKGTVSPQLLCGTNWE